MRAPIPRLLKNLFRLFYNSHTFIHIATRIARIIQRYAWNATIRKTKGYYYTAIYKIGHETYLQEFPGAFYFEKLIYYKFFVSFLF